MTRWQTGKRLGPQTNLALALRLEPRLVSRSPRLITMAGAYLEGSVSSAAEFNIFADSEAAQIVFTAGDNNTMLATCCRVNLMTVSNVPLNSFPLHLPFFPAAMS